MDLRQRFKHNLETLVNSGKSVKKTLKNITLTIAAGAALFAGANALSARASASEPPYNELSQQSHSQLTNEADFNQDGIVDMRDVVEFVEQWLATDQTDRIIPVCECMELTEPNAIYVLQNDIRARGNCFKLGADGIKLNLNKKSIIEELSGEFYGIHANGHDNITINNGGYIVGFEWGIYLTNNKNNQISGIHEFGSNKYGIHLESSSGNVISHINGFFDDYGIFLKSSSNNKIKNITAGDCSYDAVSLLCGSNNNILTNVTLESNGDYGVRISESNNNLIKDSYLDGNRFVDIYLYNNSVNNVLLDTNNFVEEVDMGSSLIRKWSYQTYVTDSSGNPIANAKVYGDDINRNLEFMLRTEIDGKTPKISLIDYIHYGWDGDKNVIENFAPYTITAEKEGVGKATKIWDANSPLEDTLILQP